MIDEQNVQKIIECLDIVHPNAICELNYSSEFELLIAVILSAQCTDKRVNMVTDKLYKVYNTPQQFADLAIEEVIEYIRPCGFFNNKAKSIINCAKSLVEQYGGVVPHTMEELMSLQGVGRKTANVVMNVAFGAQTMAVDTHVRRLANRIGFIHSQDVNKVEIALKEQVPYTQWSHFHHLLIHHGRYVCNARAPKCNECSISSYCNNFLSSKDGVEI